MLSKHHIGSPGEPINLYVATSKGRIAASVRPALLAPGEEPGAGPCVGSAQMRVADVGGEEFDVAPAGVIAEIGDQRRHDRRRAQVGRCDLGLSEVEMDRQGSRGPMRNSRSFSFRMLALRHPLLLGPRLPRWSSITLLAALVAIASCNAPAADILPCARFAQEDLPQPFPRGDRRGLDRLEKINQAVRNTPYSVLFLGDSLIEGWSPAVWKRSLAPRRALNAGVSGDYTENVLWRLRHGNLAGTPPKVVVLLIGTNDLAAGRSPELTADGIRANLEFLRQHLPQTRILLLALLPREESPMASLRLAVSQVNGLIRDCGDGEHIFYADIGDVLLDGDGRLTRDISPDHLHFTAHAYALLALRLDPVLDKLLAAE
jgi:lysophospholipase L1-like esterase